MQTVVRERPIQLATGKCTFLEGEGGNLSVTLIVLLMQMIGRDEIEWTYQSEGRCAYFACFDTLARHHTHTQCIEGEQSHSVSLVTFRHMFARVIGHALTHAGMCLFFIERCMHTEGAMRASRARLHRAHVALGSSRF